MKDPLVPWKKACKLAEVESTHLVDQAMRAGEMDFVPLSNAQNRPARYLRPSMILAWVASRTVRAASK